MPDIQTTFSSPEALSGKRLDVVLAELMPDYSRSRLKQWLLEGQILLDGRSMPPKTKVYSEQQLVLEVKVADVEDEDVAEDIPLNIVYEDESLLIINKPAGLVVHPAAGNRRGTLQNALLFYDRNLAEVPRAGIVHRLDKDTSGLMVVARTLIAHKYRQARHAWRQGLHHPETGELMQWEAPLPEDMQQLVEAMKEDLAQHGG
jgi:23S rRNA pseudouridine1911/1915/1917 synthase